MLPVLKRSGDNRKRNGEKEATILAPLGSLAQYEVDNCDPQTLIQGLLTRVFFHKRGGRWEAPASTNTLYAATMGQYVGLFPGGETCAPMTDEAFLASYSGPRRVRYSQAAQQYYRSGVTRRDAEVDTFVKFEKCAVKEGRNPRVINPRRPLYNFAIGRYLKPLEKVLYRRLDDIFGWNEPVVLKGYNCIEQGRIIANHWHSFEQPVAVGIDASRFDQHVHLDALKFEHAVYMQYFPGNKELKRLLSYQMYNRGKAVFRDCRVKYSVLGRRMSGDMNTAMGNCLIMCMLIKSYMDRLNIKWRFIDNGDDCVVFVNKRDLRKLDGIGAWCSDRGFPTTIEEPAYMLEHVEFCQTKPVRCGESWKMVRDPRKTFTKDSIVCEPIRSRELWDQYRVAIAECGLSLAGDMPMLSEYYQALARGAAPKRKLTKTTQTGMDWLAVGLQPAIVEPHWTTRVSFYHAFGITPWEQYAVEETLRTIKPVFTLGLFVNPAFTFF